MKTKIKIAFFSLFVFFIPLTLFVLNSRHFDQHPLDALPEAEANLLTLLTALMTASFPVEVWRQPRVPDSGPAAMDCVLGLKP